MTTIRNFFILIILKKKLYFLHLELKVLKLESQQSNAFILQEFSIQNEISVIVGIWNPDKQRDKIIGENEFSSHFRLF